MVRVDSANRVTNTNVDIVQNPDTLSKVLRGYCPGRSKFRVRVRDEMGWSTYSPWSNLVRGR